jgi:hypothetical protein
VQSARETREVLDRVDAFFTAPGMNPGRAEAAVVS